MDPSAAAFEVVLAGRFGLEDLRVTWQPLATRRPDASVEAMIAASWERRVAAAHGGLLFAGPLCRLAGLAVIDDALQLTLAPTDYRAFLGTNVDGLAAIRARWPADWRAYLADPLGVCAIVVSADGWHLIVERSAHVAEYPGWYSLVGGHPTPAHDDGVGGIALFLAMQDELMEEVTVRPVEIARLTCIGLARNGATAKPELVFEARLTLSRADLDTRLLVRRDTPDAREDQGWRWVNDDAAALQAFLTRQAGRVTPALAAGLTLYAREPSAHR